ncbi:MAG: hypothetical protein ACR2NU_12405 [Aeoliella sp.]
MCRSNYIVFGILVASMLGCGSPTGSSDKEPDYKGRLSAAKSMTNLTRRDSALTAVAIDAGKAGEGQVALDAVAAMNNLTSRGSVAEKAAVALAKAGKESDAVNVAKQINDLSRRDKVLAKIADID